MVDYHYIKRGGKLYGPYYYRSYRDGNKVKKEYLGKDYIKKIKAKERKTSLLPLFVLLLGLAGIFFFATFYTGISGRATLELASSTFKADEPVTGALNLILKQGELLPERTSIVINITNGSYTETRQLELKKLVEESDLNINKERGFFYAENTNLSGQGYGFGVPGMNTIYPYVYFKVKLSGIEEGGEKEVVDIIDGSAVYLTPFSYTAEGIANLKAEIVSGSIYTYDDKGKEKELNESALSFEISSNKITVTTDYSYQITGFGSDFLTENATILALNLSAFELAAEQPGDYTLSISFSYQNSVIFQSSSNIKINPSNESVNNAPILVKTIPDQTIYENGQATINLADYFVDSDKDILTYNLSQAETENLTVSLDSATGVARIVPDKDFTGNRNIIFTASDSIAVTESNLVGIFIVENITEETNITNITNITIPVVNLTVNETIVQHKAIIGKPVKWTKKVVLSNLSNVTVELPIEASNITVTKIVNVSQGITGQAITERGFGATIRNLGNFISSLFSKLQIIITGHAVDEQKQANETEKIVEINEKVKEVEIEYETPAPEATEQDITPSKKIVTISGPDTIHYTDVLAYTTLPREVSSKNSIKLYWLANDSRQETSFDAYDTDNNSLIDYIEWTVPSLSNQTYEVSIAVINVQSHPTVRGNWTVFFDTIGEADLTITAINDTTWNLDEMCGSETCQLQFINLSCGNTLLDYTWLQNSEDGSNNSVFYQNYSCNEQGSETSVVLKAAKHLLKFQFGTEVAYAYNDVTAISGCSNITSAGNYQLTQAITNWNAPTAGAACMNITASDVELDCTGWSSWIDGQDASNVYGIKAEGLSTAKLTNVSVKNCNLTDWQYGVYYTYTENSTLTNVITSSDTQSGFYLSSCLKNQIVNSTTRDNKQNGLYLYYSSFNNITGSRIENNSVAGYAGIYLYSSTSDATLNSSKNRIWNNIINNTPNGGTNWMMYGINHTNYFNTTKVAGINIGLGSSIGGNYWSDYTGLDVDGDGIGDSW